MVNFHVARRDRKMNKDREIKSISLFQVNHILLTTRHDNIEQSPDCMPAIVWCARTILVPRAESPKKAIGSCGITGKDDAREDRVPLSREGAVE